MTSAGAPNAQKMSVATTADYVPSEGTGNWSPAMTPPSIRNEAVCRGVLVGRDLVALRLEELGSVRHTVTPNLQVHPIRSFSRSDRRDAVECGRHLSARPPGHSLETCGPLSHRTPTV
jgi:hypothetical protein